MSLTDFIFRWTLRIIQPAEAKRMETDGPISLPKATEALGDETDYVYIDDQGADITIFAYSGMDALFAGRARYEFRHMFQSAGVNCNMVCFRDPRTCAFHIGFDGKSKGLDFYAEKTREVMEQLGATYNVAVGSSSGGQAAFAFGTLCKMDRILTFSPAFPHSVYRAPKHAWQSFFNLKRLFTEPQAYIETLIVTLAIIWMEDVTAKRVKLDVPVEIWDTLSLYRNAGDERPPAIIYYGERSVPDSRQATLMTEFPQVRIMPVSTGRHNVPAELLRRKELKPLLAAELQFGTNDRDTLPEEGQADL